ncbi:hypothetical protein LM2 [Methanocella arvoryzae MRE50]|uniref:Uncharacterized protein n=1 Tax=Methanocella arvoryzae (strain DSM 22066 / NBRC 105507 / MRE50) TaxID=351160 RepID=Q0W8M6_METAR|nr:hypothetical protein orf5 [uncultured archaeon]CAJ35267.1 hypothetical protein LM2 [Methanocella arvoryzae MRE50]
MTTVRKMNVTSKNHTIATKNSTISILISMLTPLFNTTLSLLCHMVFAWARRVITNIYAISEKCRYFRHIYRYNPL